MSKEFNETWALPYSSNARKAKHDTAVQAVGNIVESMLINPLSRYLFDNDIQDNRTVVIEEIDVKEQPFALKCTVTE